jgi:ferredoxin
MRVTVDLKKCNDHGQCVFSAPAVFSLDDDGKLSFRARTAADSYVSGELDESLRDDVEEAADACPLQAIGIED